MKQIKLNIITKTEKYPIIIGSNLTSNILKILDIFEIKLEPIIIEYFSVLVIIFNLVCFINFCNFVHYFTFGKIITLYFI